ncbi:MAG: response regulator, partial [Firmicutes bacterium]|nr:response regulator [Candidatus Colimorpha enterica]
DVKVNVTEFRSGTELLASDYSDIDIAFLDIYMDDIDGIETARRMAETNKNVKFVFCSASPEFIDQVEDLNVFRYFIKPPSPGKFNDAMDEYMKELD